MSLSRRRPSLAPGLSVNTALSPLAYASTSISRPSSTRSLRSVRRSTRSSTRGSHPGSSFGSRPGSTRSSCGSSHVKSAADWGWSDNDVATLSSCMNKLVSMRLASAWRVLVEGIHARKVMLKRKRHQLLKSKMYAAADTPIENRSLAECLAIEQWALEVYRQDFLLLTPNEMRTFSSHVELFVTNKTEILFLQGEIGARFFILVDGRVGIYNSNDPHLVSVNLQKQKEANGTAELASKFCESSGMFGHKLSIVTPQSGQFGEVALFSAEKTRTATAVVEPRKAVIGTQPVRILVVGKQVYHKTFSKHHCEAFYRRQKVDLLGKIHCFKCLSYRRIVDLAFCLERLVLPIHTVLSEDMFVVVLRGKLKLVSTKRRRRQALENRTNSSRQQLKPSNAKKYTSRGSEDEQHQTQTIIQKHDDSVAEQTGLSSQKGSEEGEIDGEQSVGSAALKETTMGSEGSMHRQPHVSSMFQSPSCRRLINSQSYFECLHLEAPTLVGCVPLLYSIMPKVYPVGSLVAPFEIVAMTEVECFCLPPHCLDDVRSLIAGSDCALRVSALFKQRQEICKQQEDLKKDIFKVPRVHDPYAQRSKTFAGRPRKSRPLTASLDGRREQQLQHHTTSRSPISTHAPGEANAFVHRHSIASQVGASFGKGRRQPRPMSAIGSRGQIMEIRKTVSRTQQRQHLGTLQRPRPSSARPRAKTVSRCVKKNVKSRLSSRPSTALPRSSSSESQLDILAEPKLRTLRPYKRCVAVAKGSEVLRPPVDYVAVAMARGLSAEPTGTQKSVAMWLKKRQGIYRARSDGTFGQPSWSFRPVRRQRPFVTRIKQSKHRKKNSVSNKQLRGSALDAALERECERRMSRHRRALGLVK